MLLRAAFLCVCLAFLADTPAQARLRVLNSPVVMPPGAVLLAVISLMNRCGFVIPLVQGGGTPALPMRPGRQVPAHPRLGCQVDEKVS